MRSIGLAGNRLSGESHLATHTNWRDAMFESIKGFWTLYQQDGPEQMIPLLVIDETNDCLGCDLYEIAAQSDIWPFCSEDWEDIADVDGDGEFIAIMPHDPERAELVFKFTPENPHPHLEPYNQMLHRVWNC